MATKLPDMWVKGIGEKRGAPYIYFDGMQAVRTGFVPGQSYEVTVDEKSKAVILTVNKDGSRTVSAKRKGDKDYPVIDINSKELLSLFDGMSSIRVVVQQGRVYLLPLASELKKRERINRIVGKMQAGAVLSMGSLSHGGGILSHAIHEGLKSAGIKADLAFVNEIREDLVQQAFEHNDAWNENTTAIAMPMQEAAQDEWLLAHLPKIDILEMGLPCSGASKAGASKRGLSKMEDHPEVGHLVFSALVILNKTQPVVVLLENVPEYADSASAQILRHQLRDMGYQTHEAIIEGRDFGCIENRIRWCMVATTDGLDFDFDQIKPSVKVVRKLDEFIDKTITPDDPRWRAVEYLKEKERRDADKGNSFSMQFVSAESTSVPTLRKGYQKGGSTDPRVRHPDNPELSRLLTATEHARIKGVPESLIEGLSDTIAHQLLGQGIAYAPFEAVGKRIGECLMRVIEEAPELQSTQRKKTSPAFGIG